jgi:hypothetical protein
MEVTYEKREERNCRSYLRWVILRMPYYHVTSYTFSIFKKAEVSCWQRSKYCVYGVPNSLDDDEHWRETYSPG